MYYVYSLHPAFYYTISCQDTCWTYWTCEKAFGSCKMKNIDTFTLLLTYHLWFHPPKVYVEPFPAICNQSKENDKMIGGVLQKR